MEIKKEDLGVLPIRGGVLFPNLVAPIIVTETHLQKMIEEAMNDAKLIFATLQRNEKEKPDIEDLYSVGTIATILKFSKMPVGPVKLIIQGVERARIRDVLQKEPYLKVKIEVIEEPKYEEEIEIEAFKRSAVELFQELINLVPYLPDELGMVVLNIKHPGQLADFITAHLNIPPEKKQEILETIDIKERLKKVINILQNEISIQKVSKEIREKTKKELDEEQRKLYLQEQLKAIQKELGILDERTKEIEKYRKLIKKAKMPEEVEKVAFEELDKLKILHPASPEYAVSKTYLDWLVSLPWSKETVDNTDIERAEKILDEDHYNLEKVKKRILEFLAVRKLKTDTKGPILCFVGPPGVGKTSLGKSIARSLGRKFVRISLGGVRDEAEIRGHRRTYVGALPGKIIQAIKRAGVKNPLIMLDEIDKLGADFRGDPASALLEVLDPEQNHSFRDHYLDVPFDLSKVFFITTANVTHTIPPALLDRMEIIEIPGYVDLEKVEIAKKYLIPRQIKETGLKILDITFSDEAILKIIRDYTREAGLRELERKINAVCRKIAFEYSRGKLKSKEIHITPEKVEEFLGPPIYYNEVISRKNVPGVITGLAWTPTGGDIIFIESLKMPGGKNLILTGQLGEVMKESAEAALSLVRARAKKLGIDERFYEKSDIHIHVPEGAIPKDGPSAGIAIFSSLVSLLTEKPVDSQIAMTGEITLSGRVLPVGGIKEKVIAGKRAGIKKIIMPKWNEKDLKELPTYVKEGIEFVFVENVDEVLKEVF